MKNELIGFKPKNYNSVSPYFMVDDAKKNGQAID